MNELKLDKITIGDRYHVRGRISTGSYAEVFVARDLQNNGREVVIKALNTDLQGTPDFGLEQTLVANFEKEASILESISHPAKPPDVRNGCASLVRTGSGSDWVLGFRASPFDERKRLRLSGKLIRDYEATPPLWSRSDQMNVAVAFQPTESQKKNAPRRVSDG